MLDSGDESDDEPMYTDILEYFRNGIQSHPNVNRRDAHYKISDSINQRQLEWKEALKATQNMGKGSHKVFKTVVKYILQDFPHLRESGSEVSYFIPEPRNILLKLPNFWMT